ncbi:MAG: rhodanese-like domain-containing protein [Rhodocyclaceae bacterium]|nr:rhodanese-like domain-containing protein [Rhodocyclaceae bacterium]
MEFLQQNWPWAALAVASGGMLLFQVIKGKSPDELDPITATLKINREDALVVDVRSADEYRQGHIPNARHIPLADLEKRSAELAKDDKPVILCCATGARSGLALATLRKAGISSVFNLSGGLQAWERAGHPLARGKRKK